MAKRSGERKAGKAERGARRGRKAAGKGEKPSYRQQIRAKRLTAAKKSGCAPKLGMLLISFAAIATALFFRS